jgi:hypothetical protein
VIRAGPYQSPDTVIEQPGAEAIFARPHRTKLDDLQADFYDILLLAEVNIAP